MHKMILKLIFVIKISVPYDLPIPKSKGPISDICSASTASTFAPEFVKSRVKKMMSKQSSVAATKRVRAKGEASATTRHRRDNAFTIKDSSGIWGWE